MWQNSRFWWPWLTSALVLRFRRLPLGKEYLLFSLIWQHLSLSAHNLLGFQINTLNHHIPTFLPTPKERGVFLSLLKPVCFLAVIAREKNDVSRETGVGECWLRCHRGLFQLQLCCRAELVSWGEQAAQGPLLLHCGSEQSAEQSASGEGWGKNEHVRAFLIRPTN